ncbi:hypothetical protein BDW42DRAFT_25284 [Aspergillus taichungensis]|uniref:Uncharacterized protein n=1 Tax=Aspergillus taichungensis TaxID=482145 RepID=A0A2J5I529_9EURO|nr:hypothetical protein BDW42DRAFT_25284 [Aspergillus taichungensis]
MDRRALNGLDISMETVHASATDRRLGAFIRACKIGNVHVNPGDFDRHGCDRWHSSYRRSMDMHGACAGGAIAWLHERMRSLLEGGVDESDERDSSHLSFLRCGLKLERMEEWDQTAVDQRPRRDRRSNDESGVWPQARRRVICSSRPLFVFLNITDGVSSNDRSFDYLLLDMSLLHFSDHVHASFLPLPHRWSFAHFVSTR